MQEVEPARRVAIFYMEYACRIEDDLRTYPKLRSRISRGSHSRGEKGNLAVQLQPDAELAICDARGESGGWAAVNPGFRLLLQPSML